MSDAHIMPNVLLGETPHGTLLITDMATGEQSQAEIVAAESGTFYVENDLPLNLYDVSKAELEGIFSYGITLLVNGGKQRGGVDIKGTVLMHGDTFSVHNTRRTYLPSHVVLGVDEGTVGSSLRIIAAKFLGRWHHVVGGGQPIEQPQGGSEE